MSVKKFLIFNKFIENKEKMIIICNIYLQYYQTKKKKNKKLKKTIKGVTQANK